MFFFFVVFDVDSVGVFFFQAEDGIRAPLVTGVQTCALPISDDVGGCAEVLADVVDVLAVWAPHRRVVLADEVGQAAVVGAVDVADPDVVVGRAAVALAVPGAGAADVGDLGAVGREDALLALGGADAPGAAAVGGDG